MAESKLNKGSKIVICTCIHEEQDKLHGKAKRVANKCNGGFRCTVCCKIHNDN